MAIQDFKAIFDQFYPFIHEVRLLTLDNVLES